MSTLPASIKKIQWKTTEKRWRHRFSHYKSMGAFCCHGNQSFDLICPKTLRSLSPTPVMLHIKFDLGWPAGYRDIQVWKCGRRRRRTDDGPLLYYKLTLWAFGSGELKTQMTSQNVALWDINIALWVIFLFILTRIFHLWKMTYLTFNWRNLATSWNFLMRFSAKRFTLAALSVYYSYTEIVKTLSFDL